MGNYDLDPIGVAGAGTMGSGIALAALLADHRTILYDVDPAMLERARQYIETHLNRKKRAISIKYLSLVSSLEGLAPARLVIEAAPEVLHLKQELFARLDQLCPPPAILATNTSTLPVTAIAAAAGHPERVAGMHFFNPAPVMPLIEVVRGAQTSPETIQALVDLAAHMGKTPVVAHDTPGFIVNRVARPFYGEALRLAGEGAATTQQIDRLVRWSGGFRMGPFELMDLIGIDINFAATKSMYEQTFGEARYRPHQIQAQMVQQNALGRKTGRGFYTYNGHASGPGIQPPITEPASFAWEGKSKGPVLISQGSWSPGTGGLLRAAGYTPGPIADPWNKDAAGIVTANGEEGLLDQALKLDRLLPPGAPLFVQCADLTLTEISAHLDHPERLVGFDGLFFAGGQLATLVASPVLVPQARQAANDFINSLGREAVWVQDTPGLILPRIVGMLINEAAFAFGEGVADLQTIDTAMLLGVNYPKGPLAWAKDIGYTRVLNVLDHLHAEYNEDRYRAAPILRRWARLSKVEM